MSLPNSYVRKITAIPAYFDAIQNAEAPERFSYKFLADLDFTSSTDRLFVGILKDLRFVNEDGVPEPRYYEFLDKGRSAHVIADGIREAYSDLFAVNKQANTLDVDDTNNKLRTLYKGGKKDTVIRDIAKTFVALCEIADFSKAKTEPKTPPTTTVPPKTEKKKVPPSNNPSPPVGIDSLQYHINIVLPESRDQSVYDAIFKSLRDHLG